MPIAELLTGAASLRKILDNVGGSIVCDLQSSGVVTMEAQEASGLQETSWRAKPLFVFITVVIGITTETFVYGVVIPLIPFILKRFPSIINDPSNVQLIVSVLLASEALVGVVLAPVLGLALDRYRPRKWPFVFGLLLLMVVSF